MNIVTKNTTRCEVFDSLGEFLDYVGDNANPRSSDNGDTSHKWAGGIGWLRDAVTIAHDGWHDVRPDVDKLLDSLMDRLDAKYGDRYSMENHVAGAFVDMGAYMSGVPECMVSFVEEPAPTMGRVVRIVNSGGILSDVNGADVLKRGAAILALIEVIHKLGFGVELWHDSSIQGSSQDGFSQYATVVRLHDSTDPMDIDSLMFAVAHPAFHRRCVFSAREKSAFAKGQQVGGGYGSSRDSLYREIVDFDVHVPKLSHGDPVARDPLGWVIRTIEGLGIGG